VPEGDTVHKLARALRPLLEGEAVEGLWLRDRGEVEGLAGERVREVAALGKHFLIALGRERVLHVHLGLHGTWHRYRHGEPCERAASGAWLRLDTKAWRLVCFRAAVAECLRRVELAGHPVLSRLGPDLLADGFDPAAAVGRARRRAAPSAGELLLDQSVACGIGNVYKSEVLFLEGVHPGARPAELDDARVVALYRRAAALLRANLGGGPRTTTRALRPGQRWPAGAPRLFVYDRAGEPCLRCGARVASGLQGELARPTYWCPRCQPRVGAAAEERP
jgi:endonuclease-8